MKKLYAKDIDPKKTLILVVDLQNDFCHDKSVLRRKRTNNKRCALHVYDFLKEARKYGVRVAFSQQIFDESKLSSQHKKYYSELLSGKKKQFGAYKGHIKVPCCQKGSFGAKYFMYDPPKRELFIKNNFDIWQNRKFEKFLEKENIETIIVTGVEIICCVLYAILGAEERGFKTVVPRDLVSGVDEGKKDQDALLNIISKSYAPVVSSKEILKIWKINK